MYNFNIVPSGAYHISQKKPRLQKKKKHPHERRHRFAHLGLLNTILILLLMGANIRVPPCWGKRKEKTLHVIRKKTPKWRFFGRYWTRHLRWQLVARNGDDGHGRGRCSSTNKGIRTSASVSSPDTARLPPAASWPGSRNRSCTRKKKCYS